MSDSAITYTRGGRLAFTAGTLREHVGETCTLSFWIKLADGAVEGHDVIVYHYQNSGCAIAVGNYAIHPTSEWQLIEVSGNVVSLAPRDGSTYDGSSEFYLVNGTAYSYGEMWFYDRTASQKYDVYGIQLTLAGGGGSMLGNGRNIATNSKTLDLIINKGTTNVGRYNNNELLVEREDGFTEIVTNGTWRGIGMYVNQTNPQVGESFTFSANVRNDTESALPVSIFLMCVNASGTRVYPPFPNHWTETGSGGTVSIAPGEEKRIAYVFTWTQEAVDLLADGGNVRCTMQRGSTEALAFWKPKLERGTEPTEYRQAPEDLPGPSDTIIATDTDTLAVTVDVENVETYYYQTASTGSQPARPTTASPSGWQTTEFAFDATKAIWSCQKTTLTDGTFFWGQVSKASAYQGSIEAWNKADAAQQTADAASEAANSAIDTINGTRVWYATCSTAAGTVAKVATVSPASDKFTLTAGRVVLVKFTVTNSGAVGSLTLNVNGTGAKPIKYIYNGSLSNIPGANYLRQNQMYTFVYDGSHWVVEMNYNTNDVNRTKYDRNIKAKDDITSGHIICGDASGYQDIAAGMSFSLSYPLLYASTTISAGATSGTRNNNFLELNNINFGNNVTVQSGANDKVVYLKGTVSGNTFTVASSNWLTTVEPTSASDTVYIPLGIMTSASNGYFRSSSTLMGYRNGAFQDLAVAGLLIAESTEQFFWGDTDGAHVATARPITASTPNALMQANGMDVRLGTTSLAEFTSSDARIGPASGNNVLVDSDSVDIRNGANTFASFDDGGVVLSEDGSPYMTIGKHEDPDNPYLSIVGMRNLKPASWLRLENSTKLDADDEALNWVDVSASSGDTSVSGGRQASSFMTCSTDLSTFSIGVPKADLLLEASLQKNTDGVVSTLADAFIELTTGYDVNEGLIRTKAPFRTVDSGFEFRIPAYNNVFRRMLFTSIGNLRVDTSDNETSWAADSYFVHAPAALGTGAADDYIVDVGSNWGTTANPQWRWMKFASGYAIAWGYYSGGSWTATTAWGSLYYKETTRLSNPFTWAAAPYEWMQPRGTSYFWCINHNDATASQTGTYYLMSPTKQTTARAATLNFLQIGRWK